MHTNYSIYMLLQSLLKHRFELDIFRINRTLENVRIIFVKRDTIHADAHISQIYVIVQILYTNFNKEMACDC